MPAVTVRPAHPDESETLTAIALRSKAHWGYDAAFMRDCAEELSVRPEHVEPRHVHVAELEGRLAGFYGLAPLGDQRVELEWLFVEPDTIGTGLGRLLLEHACAVARAAGFEQMKIVADPNAEGFYAALGARSIGREPSASIVGRALPLMELDLRIGAA